MDEHEQQDHAEGVGSVAEEAARLLGALRGWVEHDGDVATGGESCRFCPLCQAISAVRGTSPEVKEHLGSAATSLIKAAASAMATHVPDQEDGERPSGRVEKIDLDETEDEGESWD